MTLGCQLGYVWYLFSVHYEESISQGWRRAGEEGRDCDLINKLPPDSDEKMDLSQGDIMPKDTSKLKKKKPGESQCWITSAPQSSCLRNNLFGLQVWQDQSFRRMDSEVQRDGRILDLIDDAWREDKLPYEDVAIPLVGSTLCSEC